MLADAERKEAAVNQIGGNLSEAQVWAVGAALVALLIALVVSQLGAARARRAGEARLNALQLQLQQHGEALRTELHRQGEELRTELHRQGEELRTRLHRQGDELRTEQQGLKDEHASKLEAISRRVEGLDRQYGLMHTLVVLLQAAARTSKARTHLAEQNTGLAERDLAEAETALQWASTLAPDGLRLEIDEIRRSLKEMEQSVEARTFPVVLVETLADRIYNLVAARLGPDEAR